MSSTDPNAWVCRHCGGPVMQRFGAAWIHDRVRTRGTPVCPHLPDLVTRREYVQQRAAAAGASQEPNS